MAEENNEDLSMEDILSSIKNILADEEGSSRGTETTSQNSSVSSAESPLALDIENDTPLLDDDILDLSPDMRIGETDSSKANINLDAELENITTAVPVVGDNDLPASPIIPNPDTILDGPDSIYMPEDDNLIQSDTYAKVSDIGLPSENSSSEDGQTFSLPEKTFSFEEILDTEIPTTETSLESYSVEQPKIPDVSSSEELPVAGLDILEKPVVEEYAEPKIELSNSAIIEQSPVIHEEKPFENPMAISEEKQFEQTERGSDAVDASASIINNFAKMFAKEETPAAPVLDVPATQVKEMGNISRTLEDMINGVISNIIGAEVSANWKSGMDYEQLARNEIIRQTRLWLEENLSAIVEKIVKEEIERVMAKVGTRQ